MRSEHHESTESNFSPAILVICLLSLGAAAYFFFFQKTWDSSNVLLVLLLLACPLMHMFMHRGHSGH
ncbi:MAG: DUF2933 domain-containing protein [Pyrinomonadaceae bacterium]|nr:DUF2933 domain-containing protein [Pyrinomonadaceae bacterium]